MSRFKREKMAVAARRVAWLSPRYWRNVLFMRQLHEQETPSWRFLPLILLAAFIFRIGVAFSGDFVIHPDEIMQYLEPAHGLVFGNSIGFWEYEYGARSWLIPGMVAGVLKIFQLTGLDGSSSYYINGVKVMFCAIALLIPYGMYVGGRHLFGEQSGRIALLLGAFWYELVGFAHKPMSEFVAAAVLFFLVAVVVRPPAPSLKRAVAAVLIAMLAVGMRFQYLPFAAVILLFVFFRAEQRHTRLAMLITFAFGVFAVGMFDFVTWGGFLQSYIVNFKTNLVLNTGRAGESLRLIVLFWFIIASGGIFVIALLSCLSYKRRGFCLLLLLAVILPHLFPNHREYRFFFVLIPVWLMLFADVMAVGMRIFIKDGEPKRWRLITGFVATVVVSLSGILNAIPLQHGVYFSYSGELGFTKFLRNQDTTFPLYRYLSAQESMRGLLDSTRVYSNSAGYYYLHKKVPFYTYGSWRFHFPPSQITENVSHIITGAPVKVRGFHKLPSGELGIKTTIRDSVLVGTLPSFINDAEQNKIVYWDERGEPTLMKDFVPATNFGNLHVWKKKKDVPVTDWKEYRVTVDDEAMRQEIETAFGDDAPPPAKNIIELVQ